MRRTLLLSLSLLAAGCGSSSAPLSLEEQLKNPLFAETYYVDLVKKLTDIEINAEAPLNKELLADPARKQAMLDVKEDAMAKVQAITEMQKGAKTGRFIEITQRAEGPVMLIGDTLYFGAAFYTPPGPDLHVYISTISDPTTGTFPDETAVDLGVIPPYGASSFQVPSRSDEEEPFYTVTLYDKTLGRVYAFLQLQGLYGAE